MKTLRCLTQICALPLATGCGHVGLDELEEDHEPGDVGKATTASGGSISGDGDAGMGGAFGGAGGERPSTGGTESTPASGGNDGSGGDDGTGGALGTGGSGWVPPDEVYEDPNRTGCFPFCDAPDQPYAVHHMYEQGVLPSGSFARGAALTVVGEPVNWGVGALQISFTDDSPLAFVPGEFFTGLDSWIYMRAWLLVPEGVITGDVGLIEFLAGDVVAARISAHPEGRLSASAPLDDASAMSVAGSHPLKQWFCLRAAIYSSSFEGSITVESGSTVVSELLGVDTRALGDIDNVRYGVTETGAYQGSGTLYWDSVIVNRTPIDCEMMDLAL